jgi:hypothetical protein
MDMDEGPQREVVMKHASSRLAGALGVIALATTACAVEVTELSPDGQGGTAGQGGGTGGQGAGTGAGGAGGSITPVVPEPGVAHDITLSVYSNGWGTLLGTIHVDSEGPVVIDVNDPDPYGETPQFYIYAHAEGFYTELYGCSQGETIDVDLDAVPERPNAIAGVIFAQQSYFADSYLADQAIHLVGPGVDTTVTTDAQGRYGFENLPMGTYKLNLYYQDEIIVLETSNVTETTDYTDLSFFEPLQAS